MLDLIISVGILALIGAAAMVSFVNSRNIRDLATSGQNTLSVLHQAQEKTLAGEGNSQWGVRLEPSRIFLFKGTSYAGSASTTEFDLTPSIEIANINLSGGGQEIIFKKLSGATDQSGTFDVRVKAAPTNVFTITVDTSGKTYQAGTAPAQGGTRVIDARHRTFVLTGSIKNSSSMTLTFSNPPAADTVVSVTPLTPYFSAGNTKFDWSGTTNVGGQNQVLRIHTLSLTDTATTLSVDRDCRYNNKKVKITFGTNGVATYEADCKTITVAPFGGTMSEP